MASSSRSATPSSTPQRYLNTRIHDAVQVAPYLTHVVRHHGQVTLIPPENAGRIRKTKKKRPAAVRAANSSGSLDLPGPSTSRSRSNTPRPHTSMSVRDERNEYRNSVYGEPDRRRAQDDLCIPDFPPPSFEEAMRASPSPLNSTPGSQAGARPLHDVPTSAPAEPAREQGHGSSPDVTAEREAATLPQEEQIPSSPSSSHSSLEETTESRTRLLWEQDREAGYSLEERVQRELERRRLADSLPRAPVMQLFDRAEELEEAPAGTSSVADSCKEEGSIRSAGKDQSTPTAPGNGAPSSPVPCISLSFVREEDTAPASGFQSPAAGENSSTNRPLSIPPPKGKGKEREDAVEPVIGDVSHRPLPNGKPGESNLSRFREILTTSLRPQRNTPETDSGDIGIQDTTISSELSSAEQIPGPSSSHQPYHLPPNARDSDLMTNAASLSSFHASAHPSTSALSSLQLHPSASSSFPRSSRPLPAPPGSEPPDKRPPSTVHSSRVSVRDRISAFESLQSRPIPPPPPLRRTIRPPPPIPGPSSLEFRQRRSDSPTSSGNSAPKNGGPTFGATSSSGRRRTPPPVPPSSYRWRGVVGAISDEVVPPPASSSPGLLSAQLPEVSVPAPPASAPAATSATTESNVEDPLIRVDEALEAPLTSCHSVATGEGNDGGVHPASSYSETHRAPSPPPETLHHLEEAPLIGTDRSDGGTMGDTYAQHVPPSESSHSAAELQSGINGNNQVLPIFGPPSDSRAEQSSEPPERLEDVHPPDDGTLISPNRGDDGSANEVVRLRPLQPMFTGPTDLDLLLARLDDPDFTYGGRSYDDLLLLEEIMGPALGAPSQQRTNFEDIPLGRVEVLRRRVTKDGRTKLKLALLGVVVDKCGICFAQFKGDVFACLLPCRHVFHENCLRLWVRRGQTCPLCRGPLCIS